MSGYIPPSWRDIPGWQQLVASALNPMLRGLFSGGVRTIGLLGYAEGAGGLVEQATSRTTAVTIDKPCGGIRLVSAAGSTSWQSFTVNNAYVEETDTVVVSQRSGTDLYRTHVTAVAAGSFRITFCTTSGTTTERPVFNFAVIKAVAS